MTEKPQEGKKLGQGNVSKIHTEKGERKVQEIRDKSERGTFSDEANTYLVKSKPGKYNTVQYTSQARNSCSNLIEANKLTDQCIMLKIEQLIIKEKTKQENEDTQRDQ